MEEILERTTVDKDGKRYELKIYPDLCGGDSPLDWGWGVELEELDEEESKIDLSLPHYYVIKDKYGLFLVTDDAKDMRNTHKLGFIKGTRNRDHKETLDWMVENLRRYFGGEVYCVEHNTFELCSHCGEGKEINSDCIGGVYCDVEDLVKEFESKPERLPI